MMILQEAWCEQLNTDFQALLPLGHFFNTQQITFFSERKWKKYRKTVVSLRMLSFQVKQVFPHPLCFTDHFHPPIFAHQYFPTQYSYPRFKLLPIFSPPSNLRHAPISKYFNHPPHTWPQAICMEQQQQRFTMFLMPVKYCFLGRNLIFLWKARSASWISTYRGWKRWQPKISCPIRKYHHHHQFYQSKILISIILSLKTSWRWKQQGGSTHDWFL